MKIEQGREFKMEGTETGPKWKRNIGFKTPFSEQSVEHPSSDQHSTVDESVIKVIEEIAKEREKIISDNKLSAKNKLKLLESNRKTMILMSGGKITE